MMLLVLPTKHESMNSFLGLMCFLDVWFEECVECAVPNAVSGNVVAHR